MVAAGIGAGMAPGVLDPQPGRTAASADRAAIHKRASMLLTNTLLWDKFMVVRTPDPFRSCRRSDFRNQDRTQGGGLLLLEWMTRTMHHQVMPDSLAFKIDEAVALLTRTPAAFDAFLRGMPGVWVEGTEGRDTWSAFDILGHLVSAERRDWMPRVRFLLEHGESRPFEPFDRFAQLTENRDKTLEQLLDDFARLRRESLTALKELELQSSDMTRTGKHPALGVVTLSQLLATWAGHDLTHLHQLSRVMAAQYRGLVGPWNAYLGVLHCAGHNAP